MKQYIQQQTYQQMQQDSVVPLIFGIPPEVYKPLDEKGNVIKTPYFPEITVYNPKQQQILDLVKKGELENIIMFNGDGDKHREPNFIEKLVATVIIATAIHDYNKDD